MKILGVITARGGSKTIPGKNIKLLAGKPLIVYTMETARNSDVFDRIILSTDSEEIAAVARERGCEVPFMRPPELARDDTPHLPVMRHAVSWMREHEGYEPDAVVILQPTSPFRTVRHIQEAAALFESTDADSVVSMSPVPQHLNAHWQFAMDDNGLLRLATGEPIADVIRRRQDLPPRYQRNGVIYIFKPHLLFAPVNPNFYGERVAGYVMSEKDSININETEDWEEAEKRIKSEARNSQP